MKSRPFFFLLCVICFTLSCKQQQTEDKQQQAADTKTVSFEYDDKMLKLMIFKGILNDSISLNVMFDTGGSKYILMSDSLTGLLADTMVYLQIGTYKSTCPVYVIERNNPIFRHFDAIIGWRFFEDKIIEISYQNKFIRELDTIPVTNDFFPIKMEVMNNNPRIPIKIFVQGKCIEEEFSIDTGFNGDIMLSKYFLDKYKINLTGAFHGASITSGGLLPGGSILGDSIVLGKFTLSDTHIGFSTTSVGVRNRLIGNKVLEHFTLILDLKNFYLYLKPNE
ncbi:MAG: hypothetical protein FWF53_12615 [Candidatus Azobacteroides sp.]|nr:hypothetical protein [Candidatus Azobacteroides sp.]